MISLKDRTYLIVIKIPQPLARTVTTTIIHDHNFHINLLISFKAARNGPLEVILAIIRGNHDGNIHSALHHAFTV